MDDRFNNMSIVDLREMLRQSLAFGPDQRADDVQFVKDLTNEIARREKESSVKLQLRPQGKL